jgi:hypothetical protein
MPSSSKDFRFSAYTNEWNCRLFALPDDTAFVSAAITAFRFWCSLHCSDSISFSSKYSIFLNNINLPKVPGFHWIPCLIQFSGISCLNCCFVLNIDDRLMTEINCSARILDPPATNSIRHSPRKLEFLSKSKFLKPFKIHPHQCANESSRTMSIGRFQWLFSLTHGPDARFSVDICLLPSESTFVRHSVPRIPEQEAN